MTTRPRSLRGGKARATDSGAAKVPREGTFQPARLVLWPRAVLPPPRRPSSHPTFRTLHSCHAPQPARCPDLRLWPSRTHRPPPNPTATARDTLRTRSCCSPARARAEASPFPAPLSVSTGALSQVPTPLVARRVSHAGSPSGRRSRRAAPAAPPAAFAGTRTLRPSTLFCP